MYDSAVESVTAYVIVPTWSIILKYCMYACMVWFILLFVTGF